MAQPQFPGESAQYREARDELLRAEIDLRRQTESVARMRRELPIGGRVDMAYVFATMDGGQTKLSDLFRGGKNTLVAYSFMYGPQMTAPCSACASILDGINGQVQHIIQGVNFVVIAKSPPERIRAVVADRGWRSLEMLSSEGNSYNTDYFGEDAKGNQIPMLNVFVKRDDGVYHTYGTELYFAPADPGQHARHVDAIWPLWNVFDYTPDGRGTKGIPKLRY
jgi:predicted dithiol-disulfide oxidoreductase (DUF899 family)